MVSSAFFIKFAWAAAKSRGRPKLTKTHLKIKKMMHIPGLNCVIYTYHVLIDISL